jgi:hypothetical protein
MTGVLLTWLIPYILAPDWTIRWMFGLFSVSDADAAKPNVARMKSSPIPRSL